MTLRSFVLCASAGLAAASGQVRTEGTCDHPFSADIQPGQTIRMHLRSGDIRIRGSAEEKLAVACELDNGNPADDVRLSFRSRQGSADLDVRGGPSNHFRLRIAVPRNSNLFVRSPAGALKVEDVTGDKDVELHAGDLQIEVGDAAEYRHADASVVAGDLDGRAFGIRKGGLFRSFSKSNSAGKYRLHAHVAAGDVVLR